MPTETLDVKPFDAVESIAKVRELFSEKQPEIVSYISRVCAIESPTGDVSANLKVVEAFIDLACQVDSEVLIEQHQTEVGTHVCFTFFHELMNAAKPTLVIGHTDTVHARDAIKVNPLRIEGDKLYAPGVYDMKASDVLALQAVRALTDLKIKPPRAIRILLTCDEETGSATSRELIEREALRAAQVLVVEPAAVANGEAKTSRKGVGSWTLRTFGIASHAGLQPELGASAIDEIMRQALRLREFSDKAKRTDERSGVHINIGTITGGTRSNVVAANAEIEIDARFATMKEAASVCEFIEGTQAFDRRVTLEIEGGINRPPLERTEDVVKLYEHARELGRHIGFELGEASVGGASDGNFVSALGVPVLDGLGVRGDGAHATHEHILISDIATRGALLAGLLATL